MSEKVTNCLGQVLYSRPAEKIENINKLQPGDHIYFERGHYHHHAIVKDVNTTTGSFSIFEYADTNGNKESKASVVENRYEFDTTLKVFRMKHEYTEKLRKRIIELAQSQEGQQGTYDLVCNNCEHFATWCATESRESKQVDNAAYNAMKAGTKLGAGLLAQSAVRQWATSTAANTAMRGVTRHVGAAGRVAGCTAGAVLEAGFAAADILDAKERKEQGLISQTQYDEAVTKRVISATNNMTYVTAGVFVGQALIPIPGVGAFIGATVGAGCATVFSKVFLDE